MSTIYIICIIFSIAYRYYQFKHHLDLYTYYYYKCRNNSTCISTCVYLFINSSIAAVRSFVYTRSFTCYRLLPRTIRIYMATKCACKIYLLQICELDCIRSSSLPLLLSGYISSKLLKGSPLC